MTRGIMHALLCIETALLVVSSTSYSATPAFSDQTSAAGIVATQSNSHPYVAGGCVADFNNDGWQDIYCCGGSGVYDSLLINNGDGTFTDRIGTSGIPANLPSSGAAVADFDGDGWIDLAVTVRGQFPAGQHRLYQNMQNNTFADVTVASGWLMNTVPSALSSWGGAWGDYDLDGDLDFFLNSWTTRLPALYENLGDGTFADRFEIIRSQVPEELPAGFAPRFVDMDGDRYPELLWIADFRTGEYLVNNQDGTFTNATDSSGTMIASTEMGATVADFNHDGRFDFYVTTVNNNRLYMNQGNHVFSEIASQAGVNSTGWGWATVSPDFNHDGWPDLITTGKIGQYAFINNTCCASAVEFSDVTATLGIRGDGVDDGRGMANFDYDNDGDQDIVVFCNNSPMKLYRNDLTGNGDTHWLRVFLDTSAAPDIAANGIGSVVKVTTNGFTQMGRIDGGSNYLSQSEMSAHFGLATATIVDELRVEWTNGDVTILDNVPADQTITIAATTSPLLLGDMNCDAVVDIADAAPFAIALADAAEYAAAFPACDIDAADLDGNNAIDGSDISLFVVELLN